MLFQYNQISNVNGKGIAQVAVGKLHPYKSLMQEMFFNDALYVPDMYGKKDVYFSINRFYKSRTLVGLREIHAFMADVDYYKVSEYYKRTATDMINLLLERFDTGKIITPHGKVVPMPSLITDSGNGLQLMWILEKQIPPIAESRYKLAQIEIIRSLKTYGADDTGDCARYARLAGSINSRTGQTCYIQYYANINYDFDDICDAVLPYTRKEYREKIADLKDKKKEKGIKVGGWTAYNTWVRRYNDLMKLKEIRYGNGELPPQNRNNWLFITAIALGWLMTPEDKENGTYEANIYELCRYATGHAWSDRIIKQRLGSLISRVLINKNYKYTNSSIIDLLEIEDYELAQLKYLTPVGPRYKHNRAEYLAQCAAETKSKARLVKEMVANGDNNAAIAAKLQISKRRVQQLKRMLI